MDRERHDRHTEQLEDRARQAGSSLRDMGQKISSWFRGDRYMDESRGEDRGDRSYREDFGRERRFERDDRGFRGMGPKGYKRSDERISEEVHERLTDDPWVDASDIHVHVSNGEVTLTGTVDNRETKHRAERLVEDLSGVSHVQNNLRVAQGSLTGSGRGFGSSALEAEMRRNEESADSSNNGASGLSGRTSTGALAERSAGTENSATGKKA
jgi:HSP20 family molecular chaperone IbpA